MTDSVKLGAAIIGCGVVGGRRAEAVSADDRSRLVVCVDSSEDRAKSLAGHYGCEYAADWQKAVNRQDVDVVVVATSNHMHAHISTAAAQNGKHILCEKPLARNPVEAETMVSAAQANRVRLKTGLSHRYLGYVQKARDLVRRKSIGDIVFIRGWSGRGGWENLTQSWFVDPELSGGGTLLDNGMILLDLAGWFMGTDFIEAIGYRTTNMWPIEPAEDNAYAIFKTSDGRAATLHSSWTQWQGQMLLEIHGTEGYVTIDQDSSQTRLGTRPDRWAPIQEQVFDFSTVPDRSWADEWSEFVSAIIENRQPMESGLDGLKALEMAYAVYESSETGSVVKLG